MFHIFHEIQPLFVDSFYWSISLIVFLFEINFWTPDVIQGFVLNSSLYYFFKWSIFIEQRIDGFGEITCR